MRVSGSSSVPYIGRKLIFGPPMVSFGANLSALDGWFYDQPFFVLNGVDYAVDFHRERPVNLA